MCYPIKCPELVIYCPGLASRRAEKVKPSCLDYVLIFREASRIKHQSTPHSSLRDCVWSAVSEYNKTVSKAWSLNELVLPISQKSMNGA